MYLKEDYNVSVPVINRVFKRQGREAVLKELRKLGAKRVFLARNIYIYDPEERKKMLAELKDNCAYLKDAGFEVGTWGWSFQIDGNTDPFHHIRGFGGVREDPLGRCPLDPEFRRFVGEYVKDLVKTGVDMLLFDDDYRLAYWGGTFGCGCKLHMTRIGEILGETIDPVEFKDKMLSGGPNKYREAYMQVNREALGGFAEYIRKCVDEVDPNVRIGVCSCMNWDFDGICPAEISRIMAGKTKPFLRLIGATYWPTQPRWSIYNRLGAVIEFERMERSWCDDDMEIVAEGDVYPRPRFAVPSSYLELFDTALMADGGLDGIMKYALDYTADPSYERGYVEAHCRNNEIRQQIREVFSHKNACGVRIYEKRKKFSEMEIPQQQAGSDNILSVFYSPAAKMTSSLSIPTTYHGCGTCGIVFGENARGLSCDALDNGLILDLTAARILKEQGIDTGLEDVIGSIKPVEEYFIDEDTYSAAGYTGYITEINKKAQVKSVYIYHVDGEECRVPASYCYENADGNRFLVFTFDMYFNTETCFRSYTRAHQLIHAAEYLSGTGLPAFIEGNPDLYMMTKKDDMDKLAVGLWNIYADPVYEPVVTLSRNYENIRFINCQGRLEGNRVVLSPVNAFTFAGFEVW